MSTFLAAFAIIALSVLGMAVGVLLGRNPIRGSCGGIGSAECAACTRPCRRSDERRRAPADDPEEG